MHFRKLPNKNPHELGTAQLTTPKYMRRGAVITGKSTVPDLKTGKDKGTLYRQEQGHTRKKNKKVTIVFEQDKQSTNDYQTTNEHRIRQ